MKCLKVIIIKVICIYNTVTKMKDSYKVKLVTSEISKPVSEHDVTCIFKSFKVTCIYNTVYKRQV